jgi:adenylate cyclase
VSRRRGRLHTALFLAIGLGVTGFALLCFGLHFFKRVELTTADTRFSLRGDKPTPSKVAVVGVDVDTFSKLQYQWPYPRSVQASVIQRLHKAGAKVVAMDIQFSEPTTPMPGCGRFCEDLAARQDNLLIQSVSRNRPVVLATTEVTKSGRPNVFGGADLRQFHTVAGFSSLPPDADGVIRRIQYQQLGLKTFALITAERFVGHPIPRKDWPGDAAWIDYAGPPGAVTTIPYWRVWAGKFDPKLVRGKAVIVGSLLPILQDVHPTPTSGGGEAPGPEIQATAVNTILDGFPLRDAPHVLDVLLICILGLIPPLLGLRLSVVWTIVSAVALGGLYSVGAQYAFNHGRIVAFIYPVGALALSTVGALGAHYVLAAFERQRTRDTFARFVPETVVNQVLAQTGGELRLGGERVVGTCMFTDLRNSTKFAESLPPETVVEVINKYLGELTEAILGQGGTLVSYLGDGFMAVFGAPIEQPDHADRAVAAGREILGDRLPRFNEWFREQGLGDGFRIGVGINSGPFMAGNVGSEKRLEYTAMGDTINTASRLEGSTKESDFYMLMADSTLELLQQPIDDAVEVGEVDVRGRAGKIKVWSVVEARKPAVATPAETAAAPAPV